MKGLYHTLKAFAEPIVIKVFAISDRQYSQRRKVFP
jgi:hypothetical protein